MEKSRHVLLAGHGAEAFARSQGLEMVPNRYFFTARRLAQIESIIKKEKEKNDPDKHGTVGVVALDKYGNIAAGTSTGGLTNKEFGRIGDSPIIGAGTYADNATCGVSCTGTGEFFIRLNIAHSISDLMRYKNLSAPEAADFMIHRRLEALKGDGGVICLDKEGNAAISFNTPGMFRAYENSDGEKWIRMFKDEQ
jgi:beta-aspartyl-peptidase (threonine type)